MNLQQFADILSFWRKNPRHYKYIGEVLNQSAQINYKCASITFINQSAVITSGAGVYPPVITFTDDVLVNNILLHYGQSFTFHGNENEITELQIQVQFLTKNNPNLYVHTKYLL